MEQPQEFKKERRDRYKKIYGYLDVSKIENKNNKYPIQGPIFFSEIKPSIYFILKNFSGLNERVINQLCDDEYNQVLFLRAFSHFSVGSGFDNRSFKILGNSVIQKALIDWLKLNFPNETKLAGQSFITKVQSYLLNEFDVAVQLFNFFKEKHKVNLEDNIRYRSLPYKYKDQNYSIEIDDAFRNDFCFSFFGCLELICDSCIILGMGNSVCYNIISYFLDNAIDKIDLANISEIENVSQKCKELFKSNFGISDIFYTNNLPYSEFIEELPIRREEFVHRSKLSFYPNTCEINTKNLKEPVMFYSKSCSRKAEAKIDIAQQCLLYLSSFGIEYEKKIKQAQFNIVPKTGKEIVRSNNSIKEFLIPFLTQYGHVEIDTVNQVLEKYKNDWIKTFTHWSSNQQDHYDIFEKFGDINLEKSLVFYLYRRFASNLEDNTSGVKVYESIGTLKSTRGLSKMFDILDNTFSLSKVIQYSKDLQYKKQGKIMIVSFDNHMKEDIVEALLGCIEYVFDSFISKGAGYVVVYNCVSRLFDTLPLTLNVEENKQPIAKCKEIIDSFIYGISQVKFEKNKIQNQYQIRGHITVEPIVGYKNDKEIIIYFKNDAQKNKAYEKGNELKTKYWNKTLRYEEKDLQSSFQNEWKNKRENTFWFDKDTKELTLYTEYFKITSFDEIDEKNKISEIFLQMFEKNNFNYKFDEKNFFYQD